MKPSQLGIFLLLVPYFIDLAEGKVCTRVVVWYSGHWICVKHSWWWGCTRHKYVYRPHYRYENYCCPGWRGSVSSRCPEPICEPNCKQGGTCYAPNRCRCRDGTAGDTCQDKLCSHLKPCFPGTCSTSNNCNCQNGFSNTWRGDNGVCLNLDSTQKPTVTKCTATLANIRRSDKKELYRYVTDSTSPDVSTVDRIWINQKDFNFLNLYFEAEYIPPHDLYLPPFYIGNFKFGITGGNSRVILTKIPRNGGQPFVSQDNSSRCSNSPGSYNPEEQLFKCNITDANFDRLLEHGDNLTVRVIANNGGFRQLLSGSGNTLYNQAYVKQSSEKQMVFHFDFYPPTHCSEDNGSGCGRNPLGILEDITKKPIQLMWGGWSDRMAGLETFTVEVFRLVPDMHSGYLKEKDGANPLATLDRNASDVIWTYSGTFYPTESGMYSVILGVNDAANNTRYCRKLVLYDDKSKISTSEPPNLIVTSAAKETNYSWQSNVGSSNGVQITVSWRDHFINKLHKDKKLLNKVLPFKPVKLETSKMKSVEKKFEDKDGNRTLEPIVNANGIVKFEVAYNHDHSGGSTLGDVPDESLSKWTPVSDITNQSFSFNSRRVDGDTLRIWVRAHDVMGNSKVDFTDVSFDSTPPEIEEVKLTQNVENSTYPYSSRLEMITLDPESGIHTIKWKMRDADGNKIFKEGAIHGNQTNKCSSQRVCSTIPTGQAFNYLHSLDVDNCWMVVEKDKLDRQVILLEIESFNMAMLSNGTQLKITNLRSFSGMEDYSGPMSLTLVKKSARGAQLEWRQSPSCYERTDIEIVWKAATGSVETRRVHNSRTSTDVFGLEPETNYTIEIYNIYGTQRSDPIRITFVTPEGKGLSGGAIAGIVIVILILVAVIVVGIVMWRTGRLNVAKENFQRKMTVRRVKQRLRHDEKFNNVAYQDCSDDIYIYGGMEASDKQSWYIPSSEVILEQKITSGRFADIYKAKRQIKQNNRSTVVAKILHENYTDQDEFIMKAKMNFFATVVGTHPNILEFIGGVIDHPSLGPYMLFEYCEEGTLKSWLDKKKQERISDDIFERLCRISFDIAKGLEHLAKKKIVHRRLAARNILLTSQLEAKVAGFGPSTDQMGQSEGAEEDESNKKKERIPVKWMAPECMESTKHANEASDVWSYGIVLWEMFSLGDSPYPNMHSRDVQSNVKAGHRMERPEFADESHYDLMKRCWHKKPRSRPTFQKISQELANTFTSAPSDECYYYSENK